MHIAGFSFFLIDKDPWFIHVFSKSLGILK